MKKLLCVVFVILALAGCYWTETECFDIKNFGSVNYISNKKIDSVYFYLDGVKICDGSRRSVDSLNILASYGNLTGNKFTICRLSSGDDYLSLIEAAFTDRCQFFEDSSRWDVFICSFSSIFNKIELKPAQLTLELFTGDSVKSVNVGVIDFQGIYVNVFPVQDSAKWFNYTEGSILPYFDNFASPSTWIRNTCLDSYCIAMQPMSNQDACFEK